MTLSEVDCLEVDPMSIANFRVSLATYAELERSDWLLQFM